MNPRPTLSAALIVLNEAENLRRLLPTLDWVDEIVVVDGGSSDATVAVAREHGCRVVERPFRGFAMQRNAAANLARGQWVLSLDADERPTGAMIAELRRRLGRERCAAYRVPIRSTIFGRPMRFGGTQDDRPIRLFRRGRAEWVGRVHEVLRVDGPVRALRWGMAHRTQPDLETFLTKMHRYTRLEAAERVARGRRPSRWPAPTLAAREVFRRLIWKRGALDGPEGWAFAALSGVYEWVLAREHARGWHRARTMPSRQHDAPLGKEFGLLIERTP